MTTKTCKKCGLTQPLANFYYSLCYKSRDHYLTSCKSCTQKRVERTRMRREFGMDLDDYRALLASQNNGCAICGRTQLDKRKTRLNIDHNHDTDAVRGILCDKCNKGLGCFIDDPRLLMRAAQYLIRN